MVGREMQGGPWYVLYFFTFQSEDVPRRLWLPLMISLLPERCFVYEKAWKMCRMVSSMQEKIGEKVWLKNHW